MGRVSGGADLPRICVHVCNVIQLESVNQSIEKLSHRNEDALQESIGKFREKWLLSDWSLKHTTTEIGCLAIHVPLGAMCTSKGARSSTGCPS